MPFRILVTGSSGFIGSAVSSALAAAGHSVRAASRKPNRNVNQDRLEWVELPDLENEVDWTPLLEGMDIVVHLAAIAHRSHTESGDYARANRVATASLAQACRRHAIKRLIFMSSIGAQAGSAADHVVTELDEPWPITAYDRAKLAAEDTGRIIYVRGDRTISYAQLMDALGLVNSAGFTKVSLIAEGSAQQKAEGSPPK